MDRERSQILLASLRSTLILGLSLLRGTFYFTLLVTGFALALSLCLIVVGIPLLGMMFSLTRGLAFIDRAITAALSGRRLNLEDQPLVFLGFNPLPYMAAPSTWTSLVQLLLHFPLGILGWVALSMLLPFYLLEAFIYAAGVNTGLVTGQIMNVLATALGGQWDNQPTFDIQKPKRKRTLHDLADDQEEDWEDVRYRLGDDGEIEAMKRHR
jgi:hypothetical protein